MRLNTYLTGYCVQCSLNKFGTNLQDFRHTEFKRDSYGDILVRCRGCGWTMVTVEGWCLLDHHGEHVKQLDLDYREQYQEIIERFFGDNPEDLAYAQSSNNDSTDEGADLDSDYSDDRGADYE